MSSHGDPQPEGTPWEARMWRGPFAVPYQAATPTSLGDPGQLRGIDLEFSSPAQTSPFRLLNNPKNKTLVSEKPASRARDGNQGLDDIEG